MQRRSSLRFLRISLCTLILYFVCLQLVGDDKADEIVAVVNGQKMTAHQLKLDFFGKLESESTRVRSREGLIEDLIDRELIRQFLSKRKVEADPTLTNQKLAAVKTLIAKRGEKLEEVLQQLSISEDALRALIEQQVAWQMHVTGTLTEEEIQEYWDAHRARFDGTEFEASQIFLKVVPNLPESDRQSAIEKLTEIRRRIVNEEITFADAAREYSHSPSGKNAGQLGRFEFSGRVAKEIAHAALETDVGRISKPFESPYGVHIVQVHERIDGELSLEDARTQVLSALSLKLWDEQVERERKTARIEIVK